MLVMGGKVKNKITDTQAWNYAVGIIKVDGLEPTPEFKEYIEKEKRAKSRWLMLSSFLIKDIK